MALESREGTRASRRVEEGLSRSFSGGGGKPSFPSPSAGDLRELPRVPLRGEGSCRGGGASRDSAGSGATKEGLTRGEAGSPGFLSVSDSDRRVPAELGQESQASSCLRKGTPLASRVVQRSTGPSSSCVWNPRLFPDDARGCQCRFGLCLHPQGCLRRGVRHRVLLKSGPGNRARSACGTTHVARLECPRVTGLLLRCAGKSGNPFQTTQGNRLSCRDQEGRRGSDEAVPAPSVFHSREPGVSGNFLGSHEGCQVPFRTSGRNRGLPLRRRHGQVPHLAKRWEPRGFSRVAAGFSCYDRGLQASSCVGPG